MKKLDVRHILRGKKLGRDTRNASIRYSSVEARNTLAELSLHPEAEQAIASRGGTGHCWPAGGHPEVVATWPAALAERWRSEKKSLLAAVWKDPQASVLDDILARAQLWSAASEQAQKLD